MAIIVVGAAARKSGKTSLVCGLIVALPKFAWIAVKITTHPHTNLPPIYEETAAGQGIDTARYLAAGARRAFLVSAPESELASRLRELRALAGPEANLIFESNRVLRHLQPDLCLAIEPESDSQPKSSFALLEPEAHATVRRIRPGAIEKQTDGAQPVFELADFERISEPMRRWLRERLPADTRAEEPSR
jgi:hypothetical protein